MTDHCGTLKHLPYTTAGCMQHTCGYARVKLSTDEHSVVRQTPRKPSRSVVEAKAELTFPTSALAFAVIVSASTE